MATPVRFLVLCLLLNFAPLIYTYKSYEGYQVLRTPILTEHDVRMLRKVQKSSNVDFWLEPRAGKYTDIMVAPQYIPEFTAALNSFGIDTSVIIENVEEVVQKERYLLVEMRNNQNKDRSPSFDTFPTWKEIEAYLDYVVSTYPTTTSLITIGYSYEGRPLRVLKISDNIPGKPAIFLEGAVHAREWIGPPTLLYAINELTENINNNSGLLDHGDVYILVVTNPDGYTFTHNYDRFWRKTRNYNEGSVCFGTDPNRNYDYAWDTGSGSSPSPCSDTYRGTSPFSCSETRAVSTFLRNHTEITCFVDVHSYGKYLLTPWGDSPDLPRSYSNLERVGNEALANLNAVFGTEYTFGSTFNTLYEANGVAEDWAYGVLNIPLAYVIELPGGGYGGFNPPETDILPVATETWEFYKTLIKNLPPSRD